MPEHALLLAMHLIAASVWVGGHLVLALGILPGALARRDVQAISRFEAVFERLGIPALLVQVGTGVPLALRVLPNPADWIDWSNPLGLAISLKLALLAATALLAIHARLFIIPKIDAARLPLLAAHIVAVSVFSVGFVLVGLAFRFGGIG